MPSGSSVKVLERHGGAELELPVATGGALWWSAPHSRLPGASLSRCRWVYPGLQSRPLAIRPRSIPCSGEAESGEAECLLLTDLWKSRKTMLPGSFAQLLMCGVSAVLPFEKPKSAHPMSSTCRRPRRLKEIRWLERARPVS